MLLPPGYQPQKNRPGLARLKLNKKQLIWLGVLSLVIFVGLIVVWYIFIGKQGNFSSQKVDLTIELPEKAVNGEVFELKIKWQNNEKVAIKDLELGLQLPLGFSLITNQNENGGLVSGWSLDDLQPGGSGEKKFEAKVMGDPGSKKTLEALLTYQPENFSSRFQQTAKADIAMAESDLEFSMIVTDSILSSEDLSIKIKYKNTTNKTLTGMRVQMEYPDGFEFSNSDPVTIAKRKDMFSLLSLGAGDSGVITINGKLNGDAGEKKLFKASLGIVDQFKQFYPQVSASADVLVVKPDVNLILTANKDQILNISPGEEARFNIKYKNVGNVTIKNAVIEASFEPDYFDLNSLNIEQSGVLSGDKIVWTETADPELKSLEPGQGGDLRWQVRVKPVEELEDTTFSTPVTVNISSRNVKDLILVRYSQTGNEVEIRSISGLDLAAEARYYDIELAEIGSGPLPPEIGQETTYVIFFTVVNDLAKLENVRLIASLNKDDKVSYRAEDTTSAGSDLRYSADDKEVIWEIGNLEKSSEIQTATASFRLALTPAEGDSGQIINLLDKVVITAYDPEAEKDLQKQLGPVDTDLETDFGAVGKGEVKSEKE